MSKFKLHVLYLLFSEIAPSTNVYMLLEKVYNLVKSTTRYKFSTHARL